MKFEQFVWCTFASIFVILSCAQQYQCISHDSTVGFCANVTRTNSLPLVSKVIHKPNNKFMKFVRKTEITIRFPETGELALPISCVIMRDNATDGTGGFAMIKEGGVHYKHVVIYFKSQSGKDIRFHIDIYAQQPYGIPVTSSFGTPPYPNNAVIPPYPSNVAIPPYPSNVAVPPYPSNAAVPPAGWIYPANTYQPQQQQPYVFNG